MDIDSGYLAEDYFELDHLEAGNRFVESLAVSVNRESGIESVHPSVIEALSRQFPSADLAARQQAAIDRIYKPALMSWDRAVQDYKRGLEDHNYVPYGVSAAYLLIKDGFAETPLEVAFSVGEL